MWPLQAGLVPRHTTLGGLPDGTRRFGWGRHTEAAQDAESGSKRESGRPTPRAGVGPKAGDAPAFGGASRSRAGGAAHSTQRQRPTAISPGMRPAPQFWLNSRAPRPRRCQALASPWPLVMAYLPPPISIRRGLAASDFGKTRRSTPSSKRAVQASASYVAGRRRLRLKRPARCSRTR